MDAPMSLAGRRRSDSERGEHRLPRVSPGGPADELREFASRRAGMIHAMDGGLWLHRHSWQGHPMAHLVSTDRERLLRYGRTVGLPASRLQYKALKDPRTGARHPAWHWDLVGPYLPPPAPSFDG